MSNLIWKGPSNALVMQPISPRLAYGERVKATDIYRGPQPICAESMLARGTFGTGFRAGWVVNQCTCESTRGGIGLLTIEWEAGGSEADQPLPVGDFNLEPQELYPKIERNHFFGNVGGEMFSGILPDTIRAVYSALYSQQTTGKGAQDYINSAINGWTTNGNHYGGENFAIFANTSANAQNAYAWELLTKLANGEESYYIAGYRYSWTEYSYTEPSLSQGGIIYNAAANHTPGGPLPSLPNGISWLRLADKVEPAGVNGSMYKLTLNFIGGPNGYWDTDLYTVF